MQFNDCQVPSASSVLQLPYIQLISLLLAEQQQLQQSLQNEQFLLQQQILHESFHKQQQPSSQIPNFSINNDISLVNSLNFADQFSFNYQSSPIINFNSLRNSSELQQQTSYPFQYSPSCIISEPLQTIHSAQYAHSVPALSSMDSFNSSSPISHAMSLPKTKKIHKISIKNERPIYSEVKPSLNSSSSWSSQETKKDNQVKLSSQKLKKSKSSKSQNSNKLSRLEETKAERWNFMKKFYDKQVLVKRVFIDLDEFIPSNESFALIKREEIDTSIPTN